MCLTVGKCVLGFCVAFDIYDYWCGCCSLLLFAIFFTGFATVLFGVLRCLFCLSIRLNWMSIIDWDWL